MSSAERAQSDERPTDSFSGHSVTCHLGKVFVPWVVRGSQQAPASPYNVHRYPYGRLYVTGFNSHYRPTEDASRDLNHSSSSAITRG